MWEVVRIAIKAIVSIAKTSACTNPTIISRNIKGRGKINAKSDETVNKTISPANILPKSLKERDITLVISEIISKPPIKRLIGLKEINLLMYS